MAVPSGNILTLWDKALPPDKIPAYPTYRLAEAVGGELTYEIDQQQS